MASFSIRHLTALAAAIVCVSTAGPFIVAAHSDSRSLVFWRTLAAAGVFFVLGRSWPGVHRWRVALGGALMGAHFVLWVYAFELTSYSSNVVLLIAQPVIAALLTRLRGGRLHQLWWIALVLAGVGLFVITGGDLQLRGRALVGDLLCVIACGAIALFYEVTTPARQEMNIWSFLGWVMLWCAATVAPLAAWSGSAGFHLDSAALPWLVGLVLLTTLGGHGLMNYSARGVPLMAVNMAVVIEPPISIMIAAFMFGERVTAAQVTGGGILAVSVLFGALAQSKTIAR